MRPIFQRTHEVYAIYRLLVPLPVSVDWPSGRQTCSAVEIPGDMRARMVLTGPDHFETSQNFSSVGHVHHTLGNGFKVRIPSVINNFLAKLVREGRAEVIWGPHVELYWLDSSIRMRGPVADAYHTFEPGLTHTNATHRWVEWHMKRLRAQEPAEPPLKRE